jgi:hypothetical protein
MLRNFGGYLDRERSLEALRRNLDGIVDSGDLLSFELDINNGPQYL